MSRISGVLFDVDGTLVDTTYIHTVCWWQSFRRAGYEPSMATIHRSIGLGGDRLVEHVLGQHHVELTAEFVTGHDALYATFWSRLRAFRHARELLQHCHATGLTVVLASSAGRREVDVLIDVLDVGAAIDHTTCSDDAGDSKPAPDIVTVALERGRLAPESAVFVGDAVWDVEAAARAGVACVGLECGGTSAAELRRAGAVATYRDPAELLAQFSSSPLSDGPREERRR